MRILHVINNLKNGNGTVEFIMNYNKLLKRDDKIIFDFLIFSNEKTSYEQEVHRLGGRIFYVNLETTKFLSWHKNIFNVLESHGYNPDLIHVHDLVYLNTVSKYVKLLSKSIKIIGHAHSTKLSNTKLKQLRNKLFIRNMSRNTNAIWGCSEEAIFTWFGPSVEKYTIIPNSIDCKLVYDTVVEDSKNSNSVPSVLKLGHIGRYSVEKNQQFIYNILVKLDQLGYNFSMKFVGNFSSKEASEFKEIIANSNLKNKVTFLGVLTTEEVYKEINKLDLFLFPSHFEGFGTALLEAQAFSINCLASVSTPRNTDFGYVKYLELQENLWLSEIEKLISPFERRNKKMFNNLVKEKGYCTEDSIKFLMCQYKEIGRKL